jgi:uncharacterized membrane protein YhhN
MEVCRGTTPSRRSRDDVPRIADVNSTATGLLVATVVLAVVDWIAVGLNRRGLEYVFKPATMLPLIAAAVALDPFSEAARWWFVVALGFSLVGDVLLMLPNEDLFVFGLGSFLVGHIAYVVGLVVAGINPLALALGVVVVAVMIAVLAPPLVLGARRQEPRLGLPVLIYVIAISTMVACAIGSVVPAAIAGALLFYASDFAIGWSRFVRDFRGSRLVIIITYHVAQVLLVVSLVASR